MAFFPMSFQERIPEDATIESMQELFKPYGTVTLVHIPRSTSANKGQNRGFAFVEFDK